MPITIGPGWNIGPGFTVTSISPFGFTTPAQMNGSTTTTFIRSVAVNSSGLFVAVGLDNTNSPLYATSANGSTWTTPARMNGYTGVANMSAITYSSLLGLFVAIGGDSNTAAAVVFATSTNGSTWTTPARMNASAAVANMTAITVNSAGLFVAVGYDVNSYPLYATSTNGSTWTTPALMNGSTTVANIYSVAWSSVLGLFVAVGAVSSGAAYATSTNGSTWTTPALMNGSTPTSDMSSVTVNSSGRFVAVGNDGNLYPIYAVGS